VSKAALSHLVRDWLCRFAAGASKRHRPATVVKGLNDVSADGCAASLAEVWYRLRQAQSTMSCAICWPGSTPSARHDHRLIRQMRQAFSFWEARARAARRVT